MPIPTLTHRCVNVSQFVTSYTGFGFTAQIVWTAGRRVIRVVQGVMANMDWPIVRAYADRVESEENIVYTGHPGRAD